MVNIFWYCYCTVYVFAFYVDLHCENLEITAGKFKEQTQVSIIWFLQVP